MTTVSLAKRKRMLDETDSALSEELNKLTSSRSSMNAKKLEIRERERESETKRRELDGLIRAVAGMERELETRVKEYHEDRDKLRAGFELYRELRAGERGREEERDSREDFRDAAATGVEGGEEERDSREEFRDAARGVEMQGFKGELQEQAGFRLYRESRAGERGREEERDSGEDFRDTAAAGVEDEEEMQGFKEELQELGDGEGLEWRNQAACKEEELKEIAKEEMRHGAMDEGFQKMKSAKEESRQSAKTKIYGSAKEEMPQNANDKLRQSAKEEMRASSEEDKGNKAEGLKYSKTLMGSSLGGNAVALSKYEDASGKAKSGNMGKAENEARGDVQGARSTEATEENAMSAMQLDEERAQYEHRASFFAAPVHSNALETSSSFSTNMHVESKQHGKSKAGNALIAGQQKRQKRQKAATTTSSDVEGEEDYESYDDENPSKPTSSSSSSTTMTSRLIFKGKLFDFVQSAIVYAESEKIENERFYTRIRSVLQLAVADELAQDQFSYKTIKSRFPDPENWTLEVRERFDKKKTIYNTIGYDGNPVVHSGNALRDLVTRVRKTLSLPGAAAATPRVSIPKSYAASQDEDVLTNARVTVEKRTNLRDLFAGADVDRFKNGRAHVLNWGRAPIATLRDQDHQKYYVPNDFRVKVNIFNREYICETQVDDPGIVKYRVGQISYGNVVDLVSWTDWGDNLRQMLLVFLKNEKSVRKATIDGFNVFACVPLRDEKFIQRFGEHFPNFKTIALS